MSGFDSVVQTAYEFWEIGRALDAGRLIFEHILPEFRPEWVKGILQFVLQHSPAPNRAIQELTKIIECETDWTHAKRLFSEIRVELLSLEQRPVQDRTALQNILILYIAENSAKVVYNASDPSDEFDEDSGWWIVSCLYDFALFQQDQYQDLTLLAWNVLTTLAKR